MHPTTPDPASFFATLHTLYRRAESAAGVIERNYGIESYRIKLRLAGPALLPHLTPALEHLADVAPTGPAELTLCAWDSASTGTPPLDVWATLRPDSFGQLPAYSDARFLAAVQLDAGILSILDRESNLALYWALTPDLPVFERAAPFKILLHWWLRERKLLVIHAAAVGTDDGAVLLVGQTGTGKSTTALTCLNAGMSYLADDRCLVAVDPAPMVYALYNSGKVSPAQAPHLPDLLPAFECSPELPEEKVVLFAYRQFPGQVARCLPIKAILLAHLAHGPETWVEPIKPMTVLRPLATSTMVYAPGWSQADLQMMAALVQRLPCYNLHLGTVLSRIPEVLTQLLRTTGDNL